MNTVSENLETAQKSRYIPLLISVLLIASFAIPFVVDNYDRLIVDCFEVGDYAANALSVERAKSYEALLGPYSRYRFHHPGPILFYLRAAGEYLLPALSPFSAHTITQLALNLLCILFALCIIGSGARSYLSPAIVFLFIWYFFYQENIGFWGDTWGPSSIICAVVLFTVAAASMSLGSTLAFWLVTISASIALQTHIAVAAYIAPIVLLAFILYLLRAKTDYLTLHVFNQFLFGLLLWLPPIVEYFTSQKNNVERILHFRERHQGSHTFEEVLEFIYEFYVPLAVEQKALWFFGLLLFVLVVPIAKSHLLRNMKLFIVLGIITSGVSTLCIHGELYSYLALYHYALAAILYSYLFLVVVEHIKLWRSAETVVLVFFVAAIGYGSWQLHTMTGNVLCNNKPKELVAQIKPNKETLYILQVASKKDQRAWSDTVGVALYFERNGYHYCVPPNWGFMYGRERICKRVKQYLPYEVQNEQKIKFALDGIVQKKEVLD